MLADGITNVAMTLTDPKEKATVHIQRVVRGFLGRMEAIQRANEVYEKILDPRTAAYFYYNTRTLKTTWEVGSVQLGCDPCLRTQARERVRLLVA